MPEPTPSFSPDIKSWFSSDSQFHHLFPLSIQQLALKHWTPLNVVRKAVQYLAPAGNLNILDIGSGAGKFCLAAAYYRPGCRFSGIEQRKTLVAHAEIARQILRLDNVSFIHGNVTSVDFKNFDHFYFYNSFYENLAFTDKIDETVAHSLELYNYYNRFLYKQLEQTRVGTRLVTFNSLGDEIPPSFKLISTDMENLLRFWVNER